MTKFSFIVCFSLIGCVAGVQPSEVPETVSDIPVAKRAVLNPCAYTESEIAELARYEHVIRREFSNTDSEVVDRLLVSKRNYINSKVEKRCTNYNEFVVKQEQDKAEDRRARTDDLWRSVYVYQPEPGPKPLPQTPIKAGTFWCRNLTDECFANVEDCELFGDDLFECHSVAKASCALYHSTMGEEVGCYANTETCNTFCGGREEGFNGRFACMTECQTLSNENSYSPISPSYRVSNEAGF